MSNVLADFEIVDLFNKNHLLCDPLSEKQIQPASLDLRLKNRIWEIEASFLPGTQNTVEQRLKSFAIQKYEINDGFVLEPKKIYIVELEESLLLPPDLSASANPKSSTGRLDIFTRLITDNGVAFDVIPNGYCGKLYLEICSQTFSVIVHQGTTLSQIRFRYDHERLSVSELSEQQYCYNLVKITNDVVFYQNNIPISVNLKSEKEKTIGYVAKKNTQTFDIDARNIKIDDYWTPIFYPENGYIILQPDEFYILSSKEEMYVPPHLASEMTPFNHQVGEFRVHYAGFFDPGFGKMPSHGVLEVRCRDVPCVLEHGQTVALMSYESMNNIPHTLYGQNGSHYQGQALRLAKQFSA